MARGTGARSRLRREDGVAAVEFAIVSTVLFLVLFGIIEFGRTYSEYEVLQGAAREGARRAAVRAPADEVVAAVYAAAEPYTPSSGPAVSGQCSETTVGQQVSVSWNQSFEISIPFMPPATITRTITGVFRCE
ncbi:MAG: pilus assembly protein [Actinobacteria bacterium]|nr:pilus assembly protein [Actinomycetota bacterium]